MATPRARKSRAKSVNPARTTMLVYGDGFVSVFRQAGRIQV